MLLFLEVSGEPKTHLAAVFGVWSIDGSGGQAVPNLRGLGQRDTYTPSFSLALQGSLGLAPHWRRPLAGPGCRQSCGARPGPDGMVPWRQGQGHGQLWPELCLPRSDGPMVMAPPRTGVFLPRRLCRGQARLWGSWPHAEAGQGRSAWRLGRQVEAQVPTEGREPTEATTLLQHLSGFQPLLRASRTALPGGRKL